MWPKHCQHLVTGFSAFVCSCGFCCHFNPFSLFDPPRSLVIRSLTKKYLNDPFTIDLVGDSDQKLADGITMYSIMADSYGRALIIGPLLLYSLYGSPSIYIGLCVRSYEIGFEMKPKIIYKSRHPSN
ncbi:Uncharacterized protein Rs2_12609 [Raphanus sativus]|nr:Uncharacterized protein Rs2_12609 [Raphanus sativus]